MSRSPRIVFFGLPYTGKTGLLHAFADPEAPSPLSHVQVPQQTVGPCRTLPNGVVLCDVDGRAAQEIIGDRKKISDYNHTTAAEVRTADAIILALDASATQEQMLDLFRSFAEFLDDLESERTHNREVGGLPVFLTLTKCDTLWRPGDDPHEWLRRVAAKKSSVDTAFEDYLAERQRSDDPLTFGSVEVHIAATALQFPKTEAFAALDAPYGVEELRDDCTKAATEHTARTERSHKRLKWTLAGAISTVAMMAAGLLGFTAFGPSASEDQLSRRLQNYQENEGTSAVRLADRHFEKNRKTLQAIRDDFAFGELPNDSRIFVESRLKEYGSYKEFREQFHPPRLGPAEVRTLAELNALDAAVTTAMPPTEYAATWADTEAMKLWTKWKKDAALLRTTEATLHDWHRSLIRDGTQLQLAPRIDTEWRQLANSLLDRSEKPPFDANAPIPGSDKLMVQRGAPLSYRVAFEFDRIEQARADWEDTKNRVAAMRTFADLLGLATGPNTQAMLLFPEPLDVASSAKLASELLPKLPDVKATIASFPDPLRSDFQKRLRTSQEAGAKHVHAILRAKATEGTDFAKAVLPWFGEPDAKAWGQLLGQIGRWGELDSKDPTKEAVQFLQQDKYSADLATLEISIPTDLRDRRLVPNGAFKLVRTVGEVKSELLFKTVGEPETQGGVIVYRLAPMGHDGKVSFAPTDRVTAEWPLKTGDQEFRLEWAAVRSKMYQFDSLNREPSLRRVAADAPAERANGVRVSATAFPRVPLLLRMD